MQFSKNLRELRAKQNLTQERLAERIGVSRQMVARYESAENYPEMDKAIEIAKVLNCTLDDLVNSKDFAQNFTPNTQVVSVKIEKSKLNSKEKIIYSTLWCFISLFVFTALIVGVWEISQNAGNIVAGFLVPLMVGSWFAIIVYFKSR